MSYLLRKMATSDLDMIRSWRNNPDVRRFMYTRHEISKDEHTLWWQRVSELNNFVSLIFEYNNVSMGYVSFSNINILDKKCDWAFYLSKDAIRGIGSLVEFLALEYAFEKILINKLKCEVFSFNQSVIKMHHKFGFSEEGVLRREHFYDGEFFDICLLASFREDWLANKETYKKRISKIWQ